MNIANYFADVAAKLIARYDMRFRMSQQQQIRGLVLQNPTEEVPDTQASGPGQPTDEVNISNAARQLQCARPACETDEPESQAVPDESPQARVTDGAADDAAAVPQEAPAREMTVSLKQKLDYGLRLRFDLEAVRATLSQLNEGDLEAVEELSAARVGLSADLRMRGKERVTVSAAEQEAEGSEISRLHSRSVARQRSMSLYHVQGRDFNLKAFFREAVRVRESIKVENHDGHTHAVRKFALRYRFDSRISLQTLQRFNDQTAQMAAGDAEATGDYLARAGGLAEKGSAEMITAFFDTVESYLDHAEEQLIARAGDFSRLAQDFGGPAAELASTAGQEMETRIRDFFRIVDEALAGLERSFVGEELQQPLMPVGEPVVIAVDQPVTPSIGDANLEDVKNDTLAVMA